jgi:hypothetical protein
MDTNIYEKAKIVQMIARIQAKKKASQLAMLRKLKDKPKKR